MKESDKEMEEIAHFSFFSLKCKEKIVGETKEERTRLSVRERVKNGKGGLNQDADAGRPCQ